MISVKFAELPLKVQRWAYGAAVAQKAYRDQNAGGEYDRFHPNNNLDTESPVVAKNFINIRAINKTRAGIEYQRAYGLTADYLDVPKAPFAKSMDKLRDYMTSCARDPIDVIEMPQDLQQLQFKRSLRGSVMFEAIKVAMNRRDSDIDDDYNDEEARGVTKSWAQP